MGGMSSLPCCFGHVTHVKDVLNIRDEINVQVCVDCQAVGL